MNLSIRINDHPLDKIRIDRPGGQHYEKPVRWGAINLVALEPDRIWVSPDDGAVRGIILSWAGFLQ